MPIETEKERNLRELLRQISKGSGLIKDIFIEREIKPLGSSDNTSTGESQSGRYVSTLKELIEDDLKYTFDDGNFTFRFVTGAIGSGKSTLLAYVQRVIYERSDYRNNSIVIQFKLPELSGGTRSFSDRVYCHILSQTFYNLLSKPEFPLSVKSAAESILCELLERNQLVSALKTSCSNADNIEFDQKFLEYFGQIQIINFENIFIKLIQRVSTSDTFFTFVYLIDELDGVEDSHYIRDTRILVKSLIKKIFENLESRIRLMIFLAGTRSNASDFITTDPVLQSLVESLVISLHTGHIDEFKLVRDKIDEKIKSVYRKHPKFAEAWQEIKEVQTDLNPYQRFREFCKSYATEMLKIYTKYFEKETEPNYESTTYQLTQPNQPSILKKKENVRRCVDINLAEKPELRRVFQGTGIGAKTIDEILSHQPYRDLDDLAEKVEMIKIRRKEIIKHLQDEGQICFQKGVFICYNSQDKRLVKNIVQQLESNRISVWLDEFDLMPGRMHHRDIGKAIEEVRSVAVFFGKSGIGPWQDQEIGSFLEQFRGRGCPIIPVILKNFEGEPQLPPLIENRIHVDFRKSTPNPLEQLIRGIKDAQRYN